TAKMMLTYGVSRLPRRVHRRVPALLDRLEIWDTPVTHRSRSRPPRTYQDWRDGATHYTLCPGCCGAHCFHLHRKCHHALSRWQALTRRRRAPVWPRRPHAGPVVADDDDLGVEDPGKHQR